MGENDPGRKLEACGRFEWERIVRRCLIGPDLKLAAYTLAHYAHPDGKGVRPGIPRLAAVLEVSPATARRRIDDLLALGLLERLTKGGGRTKRAASYRLTLPSDLLEVVRMLGPDELTPLTHRERSSWVATQLTLDERSTGDDSL